MPTSIQLASGLGGAIGCDFRTTQNQLIFVEYSTGKLSSLNLFPPATIVAQGTGTVLKGTFLFDFDSGTESVPGPVPPTMDVFWEQSTAVVRSMVPVNGAKIINLGAVSFASLTVANLQLLPFAATPIDGNADATNLLVVGDVFAVLTNKGNYAKVQVTAYGYNLTINWVTYNIGSGYTVLGTGYTNPEDVKLSVDGIHAYVTERSGDLVKVALTSANRSAATVVATGMTAPQQLFLDEAHNAAYVIEYAAAGTLLNVNLTTGVKTPLISTLNNPVGVVLSSDLQYAYVTEQTTGPDLGRVSSIQLSTTTRTTLVKGLTAPFFLTWADDVEDSLLVPLRDPSNSIISVNVSLATSNVVAAGVPTRPSSVALATPGQLLICCDSVIQEVNFNAFPLAGPLLMGIGFIPFDRINQPPSLLAGLADTTVDPTYFYQVKDTPFGGSLPIMVNYQTAAAEGAFFYQVRVDGIAHTDTWTNYLWNGTEYVLQTISPITVGPTTALYPVHPLSELFLWYNPSLGDLLDSTTLSNGLHTIQLHFTDAAGNLLPTIVSTPLVILVNNQYCVATLALPLLSGSPADSCGVMHYGTSTTATVTMAFTASQPANFATFSFSLVRGVTGVTLPTPPPASGPITSAVSPFTDTVAGLLSAACPTAGFAGELYVAATINSGWSRQSQYDASALLGFVLTP
jgi:hypothetical protein